MMRHLPTSPDLLAFEKKFDTLPQPMAGIAHTLTVLLEKHVCQRCPRKETVLVKGGSENLVNDPGYCEIINLPIFPHPLPILEIWRKGTRVGVRLRAEYGWTLLDFADVQSKLSVTARSNYQGSFFGQTHRFSPHDSADSLSSIAQSLC